MNQANIRARIAVAAILVGALGAASQGNEPRMRVIERGMLCVTEGAVEQAPDQRLVVNVPKMRAYVNRQTLQAIDMRFTYLGATANEAKLGSGEMRRQLGLKLRSQDPCNLVYAMWRIEPESKLVVSIKTNPGQHTSAECGNAGYKNVKPLRSSPVPVLHPGDTHSLRAEMEGRNLRVYVDDSRVWEGALGAEVVRLDGPVGIRSDNARLEFQLEAGELPGAHPDFVIACKSGPDASE